MLAHIAMRLRIGGGLGRGRPIAAVAMAGVTPVARLLALAALGMVTAVCMALIAYESIRHREGRAWIRSHRGHFTVGEAHRAEEEEHRRGPGPRVTDTHQPS
jgi:hypothetical protein